MFRLEKVFQNDDTFFIKSTSLVRSALLFLSIYTYSILEFHTIYDLLNLNAYKDSNFYLFSKAISIIYFITTLIIVRDKQYKSNFLSFLSNDILPLIISIIVCFSIFFFIRLI